jgi:hypothetical protein
MKKILLVLIFSILFSSNAFSSNKFYIFGADIPGSKDSSLCAFDGDQKRYNKSTSTYVNNHGEYSNCYWTLGFTGSVKVEMNYMNSKYGTTSTALYKGKATNFANNHKSSYPDFVLNKTNGVGNEKAPQTIYVFSEKSVVVAERERLKNTPKLAETKIVEEKKVVSSYDSEEFCEQIGEPDNVSWVGGSYYVSGDQCKEGWAPTTKANYCDNAPSDYSGFKKFCSLDKQEEKKLATPITRIKSGDFFCSDKNNPSDVKWRIKSDKGCDTIVGENENGAYLVDGDLVYPYEEISVQQFCLSVTKSFLSYKEFCGKRLAEAIRLAEEKKAETKIVEEKKVATPIIKPELKIKTKSEAITTNEETMVATEVEPQLARIGEAEFGFKCEWMHWNSKGSPSYNACIDTYVNADKAEQEELRLAEVEAENQAQQAKLLEDKMNELDRMYGATCKAMGLSKKDDEFPKCMMEMMKIEQEKEQAKIQNEIAMAQIQLQQAQLEAQNKAMDLRLAELEKNNELIREANIRSQKAEAERNRQQQVLLKKQIALQEKKDKQQGWMNALMALNALQPKQPSVGFIQTMPTRTTCSWQFGQYVCNTR